MSLMLLILVSLCFTAQAKPETTFTSHATIKSAVTSYLMKEATSEGSKPVITVGKLDSRLKLHHCKQPLKAFSPPGHRSVGRISVGVRCEGNKPWVLYVPATISQMAKIAVAAHDLPRGTQLSKADFRFVERDIAKLTRGYLADPQKIIGKVLKRRLSRDKAIAATHLTSFKQVKKGQQVSILAASGGIEVRMRGKALDSGGTGDHIDVQNLSSKRKIVAKIISSGTVRVEM